jgi:hypothetical protein
MKIQLPFGRTVDTDVEPPEDTPEVIEARKKLQEGSSEPGKDGSLTQVLLGLGAFVTCGELFPKEKLDAAAKLLDELKHGFIPCLEESPPEKLDNLAQLLVAVSGKIREVQASGDKATEELLTQIILPQLRHDINRQIRYVIDPTAEKRDAEEEKEAEMEAEAEKRKGEAAMEVEVRGKPPMDTDEGSGCEHCEDPPATPPFIYAVDPIDPEMGCRSITINSVSYWKKHKCVADHYSDKEHAILDPILEKLGLAELMESTYEVPEDTDIESIKRGLHAAGIFEDPEFTKWLDGHREGAGEE